MLQLPYVKGGPETIVGILRPYNVHVAYKPISLQQLTN